MFLKNSCSENSVNVSGRSLGKRFFLNRFRPDGYLNNQYQQHLMYLVYRLSCESYFKRTCKIYLIKHVLGSSFIGKFIKNIYIHFGNLSM